jgi:hypothetical protein
MSCNGRCEGVCDACRGAYPAAALGVAPSAWSIGAAPVMGGVAPSGQPWHIGALPPATPDVSPVYAFTPYVTAPTTYLLVPRDEPPNPFAIKPEDRPTQIMGTPQVDRGFMGASQVDGAWPDGQGRLGCFPGQVKMERGPNGQIGLWPVDDLVDLVTKPAVYVGSVMFGGLPGLGAAYAADRTGVLDVLEDMLKTVGGVAVGWLSSPLFAIWCNAAEWVAAKFGGGGDVATGCIFVHVAAEVVSALDRQDWKMLGDAFRDLMKLAAKYQLDPESIVGTALSVALMALQEVLRPDLVARFFDDGLKRIKAEVMNSASDAMKPFLESLFEEFQKKRSEIENEIAARAAHVASALPIPSATQLANKTVDPNTVPHGPSTGPSAIPDPVGDKVKTTNRRRGEAFARMFAAHLGKKPPPNDLAALAMYGLRQSSLVGEIGAALLAGARGNRRQKALVEEYSRYYLAASGQGWSQGAPLTPATKAIGLAAILGLAWKFLL